VGAAQIWLLAVDLADVVDRIASEVRLVFKDLIEGVRIEALIWNTCNSHTPA